MATPSPRFPENAPGPFYITSDCIDCDMCRETAPGVFRRHDDIGFSIVFRQPATEADRRLAEDALRDCPTEAIGCEEKPAGE